MGKIETSLDMRDDFDSLQKKLVQVIEAFRNNCQVFVGDDQTKADPPENHISVLLDSLQREAFESYKKIESLVKPEKPQKLHRLQNKDFTVRLIQLTVRFMIWNLVVEAFKSVGIRANRCSATLSCNLFPMLITITLFLVAEIKNKAIKRYLNESSHDVARTIEQIGEMAVNYTKTGETMPKAQASMTLIIIQIYRKLSTLRIEIKKSLRTYPLCLRLYQL